MYTCPQCQNEILIEAHFCNRCGYRLSAALAQQESQSPTPQPHRLIRPIGAQNQQGRSPNGELPAHIGKIKQVEPSHSRFSSWTASNQEQTPHGLQTPQVLPLEDLSTGHNSIVVVKGKPQLVDSPGRIEQYNSDESFVATSRAAEHWRTSWRNRQRTEAGPATTVSRGHSSVPEPLLAMQHSLLRMRAIIIPNKTKNLTGPGFWIIFVLLLCLIGGLAVYIISTSLPATAKPVHVNIYVVAPQPTFTLRRTDGKEFSFHPSQGIAKLHLMPYTRLSKNLFQEECITHE